MDGPWQTSTEESTSSAHKSSELCGHLKTYGECYYEPVKGTLYRERHALLVAAIQILTSLNTDN